MTITASTSFDRLKTNGCAAQLTQRFRHVRPQFAKVPLDPAVASNEYMVGASFALIAKHFLRQRAKASSHPVAHDSVADLLGDRNAQTNSVVAILPVFHEQNKTGGCISLPPVSSQKI